MTPRLYITAALADAGVAPLDADQAHYLKSVLRRGEGDPVLLFNGVDGEFAAEIIELKKKGGLAKIGQRTRAQNAEPDLQLLFAAVKRGPVETIVQKAVELGAARLSPVTTERTVATRINRARLQAIATEAAEQSGRLSVPEIDELHRLDAILDDWPTDRRLMFCDEAGDNPDQEWGGEKGRAAPALDALKAFDSGADKWAILIGPEGGFAPAERAMLREKPFATPVTLGPRILRADTAAIAALSLWQAALGDWRAPAITDA
ncbi:MAG: 16S rRNA (uracil(1498)-N(3))-methyltransferase [Pseudomonadota bacterium]